MIKLKQLEIAKTLHLEGDCQFENMGLSTSSIPNTISFAINEKYLLEAKNNPNVSAVITSKDLLPLAEGMNLVVSPLPQEAFYMLYKEWVEIKKEKKTNSISEQAKIHSTVILPESDCTIESGSILEENVVVRSRVIIGREAIIRANTVIGGDGFEVKRISGHNFLVPHNGFVRIEEGVEIHSCTCVDRGIYGETTVIGKYTKIDNLCHIAHNVKIRKNCIIAAGAILSGSAVIGNNVWIGPKAIISSGIKIGDDARITIGANVVKDIPAGLSVISRDSSVLFKNSGK